MDVMKPGLDVTDSTVSLKGDGRKIAEEIKQKGERENWELQSALEFPGIRFLQSLEVIIKSLMGLQHLRTDKLSKNCSGDFRLSDLLYVGRSTR